MHFLRSLTSFAIAAVPLASANTITFVNQDATQRTIIFTANPALAQIPSVVVPGNKQTTVNFPNGWVGNAFSVSQGAPTKPGMLAEVTFQGYQGLTYFDVSAIVNPNDKNGVKQMYPVSQKNARPKTVMSGCNVFPCDTAYYHPEDTQTVSSPETDFICTLGTAPNTYATRDVEDDVEIEHVARKFVLGKF